MKKGINKEGENIFEDLGYDISFFSSLNDQNSCGIVSKVQKFLEGNLPTTVHWMNYWSESIIKAVGMEKIQKTVEENSIISFQKGILSIRDTALDVNKEEDLRFHDELQKQLGLRMDS